MRKRLAVTVLSLCLVHFFVLPLYLLPTLLRARWSWVSTSGSRLGRFVN